MTQRRHKFEKRVGMGFFPFRLPFFCLFFSSIAFQKLFLVLCNIFYFSFHSSVVKKSIFYVFYNTEYVLSKVDTLINWARQGSPLADDIWFSFVVPLK